MHPRASEFADAAADRYGLDVDVEEFESGTKTAAAAAEAVGCDVSQIASSLAFAAGDALVVVVTSGANRVSESRLAALLDHAEADVGMADPDRISEVLGWSIGGVPPLCHATDVPVLFDRTLLDHETVYAAAGTPQALFAIDPDRLLELTDGRAERVTE